jgi:CRISPR/Cas system-associated protein Cas5 (RAMP superfamily)
VGEPRGYYVNEISQAQKDKYHMFSFICKNYKVDLKEVESRVIVTRSNYYQKLGRVRGGGNQEKMLNWHRDILDRRNTF